MINTEFKILGMYILTTKHSFITIQSLHSSACTFVKTTIAITTLSIEALHHLWLETTMAIRMASIHQS